MSGGLVLVLLFAVPMLIISALAAAQPEEGEPWELRGVLKRLALKLTLWLAMFAAVLVLVGIVGAHVIGGVIILVTLVKVVLWCAEKLGSK